jgi:general stress protein YciG
MEGKLMPDRNQSNTSNRGFASMDEDKQREIASKGGHSVPAGERSFSKDHELAAEAGRKGGEHSHGGQSHGGHRGGSGNFAENRERASEAGRKGGQR